MEYINVAVRIRPLKKINGTFTEGATKLISSEPPVLCIVDREQKYSFDHIFDEDANQETIYDSMVRPLVNYVKDGYNCTVFAYGQTGTGKTYTIGSNVKVPNTEDAGLIPRALDDFFSYVDENVVTEISISFYEIYNEKVYDLLGDNKTPLQLKEFKVQGLRQEKVFESFQAKCLLKRGSQNRHIGETKQNSCSSRSHAIFTIICNMKYNNHETIAKLNLVDLAGSESIKKTGNKGMQLSEGININKGLLCIGQVMDALSANKGHIPYRQSMITSVLQDSLCKKNYVTLVACISPNIEDVHETSHTLDFAQRVKRIKNKPEVNRIFSAFKSANPNLFERAIPGSAAKSTPRKIFKNHSYQTPSAKRIQLADLHMNTFPTPFNNQYAADSSACSFSHNLSSVSTSTQIMGGHSTPTSDNKENNMVGSGQKLEATVTRIVRREIEKLAISQSAIFSSPLRKLTQLIQGKLGDQSASTTVKKCLDFDDTSPIATPLPHNETANNTFKVPDIPKRANAPRQPSRKRLSSPLDESNVITKRARLSLKKTVDNNEQENAQNDGSPVLNASIANFSENRRRSVRLLEKTVIRRDEVSCAPIPTPRRKNTKLNESVDNSSTNRRRSVRLLEKSVVGRDQVPDTPVPVPRRNITSNERLFSFPTPAPRTKINKTNYADSPGTAHTKHVLDVLNNGSERELQKLATIGHKTASLLYAYRTINNKFNRISDLKGAPFWRGKGYERFCQVNFLKTEIEQ